MLTIGLKGSQSVVVSQENTAAAVGSGALEVFSTPAMIALMEKTCLLSVQGFLEEGQSTVGMKLDVAHLASTPVGLTVWAESELVSIDRKILTFKVKACAGGELIGEGTHVRCIVNSSRFMEKALGKLILKPD